MSSTVELRAASFEFDLAAALALLAVVSARAVNVCARACGHASRARFQLTLQNRFSKQWSKLKPDDRDPDNKCARAHPESERASSDLTQLSQAKRTTASKSNQRRRRQRPFMRNDCCELVTSLCGAAVPKAATSGAAAVSV